MNCTLEHFTPQGTFEAVIDKLDHLSGLGVTHIELMPVNEFSGERGLGLRRCGHLRAAPCLRRPGRLEAARGCLPWPASWPFFWMSYIIILGRRATISANSAPYFTRRYSSPWGDAINFDDAECGKVRRFFCDNALMWLRDYHFDGLRLDAVQAIFDASAIPFLEQLAIEVKQLEKQLNRPLVFNRRERPE